MIFGKTDEQKFVAHKWFAWHPVRLENGKWIWLEYVTKKPLRHIDGTIYRALYFGCIWIYERI